MRNHVADFTAVVIINDGSAKECEPIFCELERIENLTLLRHGETPGKGAALKTGFNHIFCYYNDVIGAVTMDADGQHLTQDALKIAILQKNRCN